MKPQFVLSFAGLLMLTMPGCCVFEAIFGCGHFPGRDTCGQASCGCEHGQKHAKKCDKKCRKCRECLEKEGLGGYGYAAGYGDFGGDCGCGGGGMMMPEFGGGGCGCSSCGQGGPAGPSPYESSFMTPPMTVPTPGPGPSPMPGQQSGTALPPPIPPTESSSLQSPVPAGMQQVSVEEFQRLPGVIVSGPGSQTEFASTAQVQPAMSLPVAATAPGPVARPIQPTATITSAPANAKQIQQTGWAPVLKQ